MRRHGLQPHDSGSSKYHGTGKTRFPLSQQTHTALHRSADESNGRHGPSAGACTFRTPRRSIQNGANSPSRAGLSSSLQSRSTTEPRASLLVLASTCPRPSTFRSREYRTTVRRQAKNRHVSRECTGRSTLSSLAVHRCFSPRAVHCRHGRCIEHFTLRARHWAHAE